MNYKTLTVEQVIILHSHCIEDFGGESGGFPETEAKIDSSLAQLGEVFGYERYGSIEQKASALLYLLAKNHCFRDGNKRIAFVCCDVFLTINGRELTLSEDQATELTLKVANSSLRNESIEEYINEIAIYLKENCI